MHKSLVTRSFEGTWSRMSINGRGILLPPPILEAINLKNPDGKRDQLVLFEGNKLEHDLTYGLIHYLRAYDLEGVRTTYLEGCCAQIKGMRLGVPKPLDSVLPIVDRIGIVGFENYFDIMNPRDMEAYTDLLEEESDDVGDCL